VADDARWIQANEHKLVLLARALIAGDREAVVAAIGGATGMHPAISTSCEQLLGDALSKAWPALWCRGGSQPGASIAIDASAATHASAAIDDGARDARGDHGASGPMAADCALRGVRRGRIWERHTPVGLSFSAATLQLLRWMLAAPLIAPALRRRVSTPPFRVLEPSPLTVGDQVMVYLALDAVAGTPAQAALAAQPLIRATPLAWLGFADRLGGEPLVAFDGLCAGAGAIVVEALSDELARRWRAVEESKAAIEAPKALIALGAVQDGVLQSFLAACDRHRRRDLAGFVIDAAAPLLRRGLAPWPVKLDPSTTLAHRAAARVAAGALLRAVAIWAAWDRSHRGIRFLEDDYPASQLLLGRFEAIGAHGGARAEAWLAELAALAPSTAAPASPSAATIDPL
jgi:hypothetical protein